jgi:hypothetical protein
MNASHLHFSQVALSSAYVASSSWLNMEVVVTHSVSVFEWQKTNWRIPPPSKRLKNEGNLFFRYLCTVLGFFAGTYVGTFALNLIYAA